MKFKRITNLDKPFVLYLRHYFEIRIRYEYDLDGFDMSSASAPDLSAYNDYGDFTLTTVDTPGMPNYFDVIISGRFYQTYSDTFFLTIGIPFVTLPSVGNAIDDYVKFDVRPEYFWSGNPIRLPLFERPEDPLKLFAETSYKSGDFKEIASINIQDVQDENGYYVEVNDYLNAWIGSDGWKDFKEIYTNSSEQNEYRYSIRRFHIVNAASQLIDRDTPPLAAPNYFVVVHGRQNPSTFFESGDAWNLDDVMSWRQTEFTQRIGNNVGNVRLPFSIFDKRSQYKIDMPVVDDGTETSFPILANYLEQVKQVVYTERYIFLLVQKDRHTLIYVSERNCIFFRVIHRFDNLIATFLLASGSIPDTPELWMFFRKLNGDLACWNFSAGIFDSFTPTENNEIVLKSRIVGEALEWRAVCMDFNNTKPAALFGVEGDSLTYFVHLTTDVVEFTMVEYSENTGSVIAAGNDNSSFIIGEMRSNQLWFTNDDGDSFSRAYIAMTMNARKMYRIDSTQYLLLGEEEGVMPYAVLFQPFYPGITFEKTNDWPYEAIGEYQDFHYEPDYNFFVFYQLGTPYFYKGIIDTLMPWTEEVEYFDLRDKTGNKILFYTNNNGIHLNAITQFENNWCAVNTEVDPAVPFNMPPSFYVRTIDSAATDEPYEYHYTYGPNVLKYRYDGQFYRNQRALYFKNQAGAYEILMLLGEGQKDLVSKKQMSTRYVDKSNAFESGEDFTAWITEAGERLVLNSGWLTKIQYEYFLNELNLSKEGYLTEPGIDPVPVNFTVNKPKPIADAPEQYSIELTINKAWNRI